jgi:spermidine synthase
LQQTETVGPGIAAATKHSRWPQIYFGVAATSLATLLLELALTRLFSVIYYYHFAFLAISIALFGLGAGGVLSYLVNSWPGSLFTKVGALAALNAVAIVVSLCFLTSRVGSSVLLIAYFVAAVPFLLAGTILSLVIADTIQRVERVYFFDLIGAASGCLVLVPLLDHLGGPNTILVAGVVFAVSSAIWFHIARLTRGRVLAVVIGLLLVGLITYNAKYPTIDVRFAKGQPLRNEQDVRWNSFSRIALKRDGGMESIVIDADAATAIAKFDFAHLTPGDYNALHFQGISFPYVVRPGAKTLIIGPGGGWDVARALAAGSNDITGVEINPIIANVIMQQRYPAYSNRLYFRPGVKIVVEEGRSFVRRSPDKFQVLQATLVDTWASTAAGAFALSENNLYTTDAFTDYLRHLTDDGVMAFTRWGFVPPRESLRVVALAIAALERLGQKDAAQHVVVLREHLKQLSTWGALDTILISRQPFTERDLKAVEGAAKQGGVQVVYIPGTSVDTPFRSLLIAPDRAAFYASYPFDVRPVNDDRPFFFYTVQPRDVWQFLLHASRESADFKINRAVPVLFTVVAVSIVATLIILSLPPLVLRSRLPKTPGGLRALLFFLCIGIGYILIQVALIQKFVLFLGHPTKALTVIIFSMLISSGAGSYASKRLIRAQSSRLIGALVIVAAGVFLLAVVVTPVVASGVALPLAAKEMISVLLIGPVGFVMGMPFPTGLSLLERVMPASVRWAWAINAASSVMGSAAGIFLAIYIGLSGTLLLGGCCYLAACVSVAVSPLRRVSA